MTREQAERLTAILTQEEKVLLAEFLLKLLKERDTDKQK